MRKRTLSLVLAVVLLAVMTIPMIASAYSAEFYVYTSNGKSLNMRSAMVTHANNRIASIPYGAEVTVKEFIGNKWAKVNYDGKTGYVMSRYLVASPPAPKPVPKPTTKPTTPTSTKLNFSGFAPIKYNVTVRPSAPGGFVNLRWAPSKSIAVIQRLYDGQALEVIAQDKTWAQVRITGTDTVGFIMRSFLSQAVDGSDS